MEVVEIKLKKQSVTDLWKSLKNQFVSTQKYIPKSTTNWNAFSKKTKASSESIIINALDDDVTNVCVTQPFILGIPRHHKNIIELDKKYNDLRDTAKIILSKLEKEKQAGKNLVNVEEDKKSTQPISSLVASTTTLKNVHLIGTSCDEILQQSSKVSYVKSNDDGTTPSKNDEMNISSDKFVEKCKSDLSQEISDVNERSLVLKLNNPKHIVEVNSTFSHLKSKLSKSIDHQIGMSKNHEKFDCENNLNHEDPIDSTAKSNNGIEEAKNIQTMENNIFEYVGEIFDAGVNQKMLSTEQDFSLESNFFNAFSTHDEYSKSMQEEDKPTSATDEELMKVINKYVNCLHSSVIDVRYKALHSLHHALLGDFVGEISNFQKRMSDKKEDQANPNIVNIGLFESQQKFAFCVEEVVAKPLLKIISDSSERCRYLSISILIALLHSIPKSMIILLPYIIPIISSRFPIKSLPTEDPTTKVEIRIVEKSEDIRLLLIDLIQELLKASKAMINPFASDIATILIAAACDSNPEVLMKAFSAMRLFGGICSTKLKPVAKQLISVVIHSLSHNRHRVRVAALHAIDRLVLCGAHESIYELTAFRDPNSVPIRAFYHPDPKTQYLALLAGDKSIQVREQLLRTVASWLKELDERKEHECHLVPYLMSGFNDESPIIQHLAFQLMQEVGHKYEEENENEVKDTQIYLPEDIDDLPAIAGRPLPPAFKSRPCLGARILVRNCCSVMLHALSGDLDAWTSGTKSLATDFLQTMLLFVEEHITMHLQQVVVMLMKALKDPLLEAKVSNCAHVLGHFVDPNAYLLIILPRITGELYSDLSIQQLAQAVKLLAKIMQGSPASRLTSHIPEICSVLTESDLMKSIQLDVNQSVVVVAKEMVKAWNEQVKEETISILWILLNAAAAADFCGRPALEAESIVQTLATASGNYDADELISTYAETILDLLPHPQFWAMRSLDVLVFCKVVQVAILLPPTTIERIFLKISWFGRGSWDPDTKLWLLHAVQKMVKGSVAVASLEKRKTMSTIRDGLVKLLENFLIPCLEQVMEGLTKLRGPTLDTIFDIISTSYASVVLLSPLAQALCNLENFEHKQGLIKQEEEVCPPSQETLLEILHRLQKPI